MKSKVLLFSPLFLPAIIFICMLCNSCKGKSNNYEPTYSDDSSEKKTLLYGVPTQAHYEIHAALVKYLNDHLPGIQIRIVASSNFTAYVDKLNARLFDLALANGVMALDTARLGYGILGTSVEEESN